jgi:hypothetical protein
MLEHVSSRELSQWMAFEQVSGPVGPIYSHAALRQIACLLNGDEKARPFPSPTEMVKYRPPAPEDESRAFDAAFEE